MAIVSRLLSPVFTGKNVLHFPIEDQIDNLAGYMDRLYALRNNDAVNRLAMMSVILGVGALITGFDGMNIRHLTGIVNNSVVSALSLTLTALMTLASVSFIAYIVASNWADYRAGILPHRYRKPLTPKSLRQLRQYNSEEALSVPKRSENGADR